MTSLAHRKALALKAATHAYLYAGAVKFEAQQLLLPDTAEDDLISAAPVGIRSKTVEGNHADPGPS
ncbi:MAG: hypothetical protein M3460_17190 [Actinomycetota bacterium]|nr:hypothetical protein [Actinomycetota bacterium]